MINCVYSFFYVNSFNGDAMLSENKAHEVWEQVLHQLKIEAGDTVFDNWLSYLDPSAYTGGLKVSGDRYNETEIAKITNSGV